MQELTTEQFLEKRNQFYRTVFGYQDKNFIKGYDAQMNYLLSSKKASFILSSPKYITDLQSELIKQKELVQQLNNRLAILLYECARTGKADDKQLRDVQSLVKQCEAAISRSNELSNNVSQKTNETFSDADQAETQYHALATKLQQLASQKETAFAEGSNEYGKLAREYIAMTRKALETGYNAEMLQDALLSTEITMLDNSAVHSAIPPKTSDLSKIVKVNWNRSRGLIRVAEMIDQS